MLGSEAWVSVLSNWLSRCKIVGTLSLNEAGADDSSLDASEVILVAHYGVCRLYSLHTEGSCYECQRAGGDSAMP